MENKKSNGLLIFTILLMIITIGLGAFIVYDKFIKEEKEVLYCPKENVVDKACETAGNHGELMLYSDMGLVFVNEHGDVYFDPFDDAEQYGEKVDVVSYTKKLLGNPKSYKVESVNFMQGEHTFGYKLDLAGVQSVEEFYFGNGGLNMTLLFLHTDGTISELSIGYTKENLDLKLFKKVSGYTDIVSIVTEASDDGVGAITYDKCGNAAYYDSPRFNNN